MGPNLLISSFLPPLFFCESFKLSNESRLFLKSTAGTSQYLTENEMTHTHTLTQDIHQFSKARTSEEMDGTFPRIASLENT